MNLKTAANNLARLIEQGGLEALDEVYARYGNEAFPKLIRQAIKDVDEAPDSPPLAWDAAVHEACKKAMVVQAGFRGLLAAARNEMERPATKDDPARAEYLRQSLDVGEALVGTLGDTIRNIAALKGQYPK